MNDKRPENPGRQAAPEQMPVSEQFKLLLEALKGYQSSFLDSGYKTLGFMVVALGWLVTSKDARDFLKNHGTVRYSAFGFLLVLIYYSGYMARRVSHLSRSVFENLNSLCYTKPDIYQHYAIKPDLWMKYTFIQIVISVLIGVVIWRTAY